jgi:hypothetical protein
VAVLKHVVARAASHASINVPVSPERRDSSAAEKKFEDKFVYPSTFNEKTVGGVCLRIYEEKEGKIDSVLDLEYDSIAFCEALLDEIKKGEKSLEPALRCLKILLQSSNSVKPKEETSKIATFIHEKNGVPRLFQILQSRMDHETKKRGIKLERVVSLVMVVLEILVGVPVCADSMGHDKSMLEVLTNVLSSQRCADVTSLDPKWLAPLLRTLTSMCLNSCGKATTALLMPHRFMLISLIDILTQRKDVLSVVSDSLLCDNAATNKEERLGTRDSDTTAEGNQHFRVPSGLNTSPLTLEEAKVEAARCLSLLLSDSVVGSAVERVLSLWLPSELVRMTRSITHVADSNVTTPMHEFLGVLTVASGTESMTPHLIWGDLEFDELRSFVDSSLVLTVAKDPTWRHECKSRRKGGGGC